MIVDISAFLSPSSEGEACPEPPLPAGAGALVVVDGGAGGDDHVDADGCLIPPMWQPVRDRWDRLALEVRRKFSNAERERQKRLAEKAAKKKPKRKGGGGTRFTTDAAVAYGRRKGWKLIDRENYDFRNKRHHDLQLALDALFDDGGQGMVGIQGAGLYEREDHYRKFEERGGVETARRRGIRVLYLEFVRGNPDPITEEWWAA